jgi:SAM dependent carboxyl methyltransferase
MSAATDTVRTAMEGSGFYNKNSSLQAAGIAAVLPLWEATVRSVDPGQGDLVIADYGASQGRNSMLPVRMAIDALRARTCANAPIEVIHTDLPSNDFASLFRALEEDPTSYMAGIPQVFPSAIGRSYFEPIIPEGRVMLGWNSWTLQWMSRKLDAPDHVFSRLSSSPTVVAAVARQQEADWRCFLTARAFELRPGAKLMSLFVADNDAKRSWRWLGGEFWKAVIEMREAGLLSEHEQLSLTFATNARSRAQIEAPFLEGGEFVGLRIEHLEIIQGADPFWGEFEATGNATKLGLSWADMMKAVFRPSVLNAFDARANREALADELFSRFASRVAAKPQRHEHYMAAVVLKKTS